MMKFLLPVIALHIAFTGYMFLDSSEYGGDLIFGAISFPTSLDSFTNPSATDRTNSPSHSTQHSNANDALEALEAKVGIDGSAVTTSHDYKLSGVTGSDVACSLTGIETLTNKTLTSPTINSPSITSLIATISAQMASSTLTGSTTISALSDPFTLNLGSDATGDIYYRSASGELARLAVGTNGEFLTLASGIPDWVTNSPTAPAVTTDASTTVEVTVDGSETILVIGYGTVTGTTGAVTHEIKAGGVLKDTIQTRADNSTEITPFYLSYAETPAATTTTITLVKDGGTIENPNLIVLKF